MNEATSLAPDVRAGLVRVAGAYARAEALVPPGPVRAADPVKPRFTVADGTKADLPASSPRPEGEAGSAGSEAPSTGRTQGSRGPGLLGGLTNFLARAFAQLADSEPLSRSSIFSGLRAYGRVTNSSTAAPSGVEVVSPGFPRLSSGRALDLTI